MAAAGPHLCLKSWGTLFQAVGVLGRAVLLPPAANTAGDLRRPSDTSRSRSGGGGTGTGGGAGGGIARSLKGGHVAVEEVEVTGDGGGGEAEGELWEALEAVWEFIFLQARNMSL